MTLPQDNKIKDNPNYFYKITGFSDMILELANPVSKKHNIEELEEL